MRVIRFFYADMPNSIWCAAEKMDELVQLPISMKVSGALPKMGELGACTAGTPEAVFFPFSNFRSLPGSFKVLVVFRLVLS